MRLNPSLYKNSIEWLENQRIQKTFESLQKRFFKAIITENREETCRTIHGLVSPRDIVSKGDSATLEEIGIVSFLRDRGHTVIDPFESLHVIPNFEQLRETLCVDVFLTSANAVTLKGDIILVDGTGNRVAATVFGPKKVILVIGENKIVDTIEDGFKRVTSLCAPINRHKRGRTAPPCAQTGFCCDCQSPDRACRVYLTMSFKPRKSDITVILVKEDLGF